MSKCSLLTYGPPDNYPNELMNNLKLRHKELAFDLLKESIDMATKILMAGDWSDNIVMAYFTANGINHEGYKK